MITEHQLQSLGYSEKSKLINKSKDFRHNDFDNRPYLVNIKDGIVRVDHPIDSKKKGFSTDNFMDFKDWHNNFKN